MCSVFLLDNISFSDDSVNTGKDAACLCTQKYRVLVWKQTCSSVLLVLPIGKKNLPHFMGPFQLEISVMILCFFLVVHLR